jgi:hypothetical protein
MSVGDYEQIEEDRRAAYKQMMRAPWGSEEHAALTRRHDEIAARRDVYLRALLGKLPFRWHVEHAYTPRETATYGGADHIIVEDPVQIGRLSREPGDALSRPRRKFWGLAGVEEGRLPTSLADIAIAERIVDLPAKKKTPRQLDAEIAASIEQRTRRKP